MMGRFKLICIFFLLINKSFALSVISDLDDTLKITNVSNFAEATRNALFSKKAFYYTSEILNYIQGYTNHLYIVSSSPRFLRSRVEQFIKFHQFQVQELRLRNLIRDSNSKHYKLRSIESVFRANPTEKFILIGDDTENDPSIYAEIQQLFPEQVEEIYIRRVKFRPVPVNVKGFFTFFELALYEFQADRISLNEILEMAKDHILAREYKLMFPKFSFCPKLTKLFARSDNLSLRIVYHQLKRKIVNYCKTRS